MSNPLGDAKETRRRTGENPAERAPKRTRTGCLTCRRGTHLQVQTKSTQFVPRAAKEQQDSVSGAFCGFATTLQTFDARRSWWKPRATTTSRMSRSALPREYLGGVERYGQVNASDSSLNRDAPNPKQKRTPTKRAAVELDRSSPENDATGGRPRFILTHFADCQRCRAHLDESFC